MAQAFMNYIGGAWVPARSGRTFKNVNPATGEVIGEFPDSDASDVDAAVRAAQAAQDAWRRRPSAPRSCSAWAR